jgi:hypothetical protein
MSATKKLSGKKIARVHARVMRESIGVTHFKVGVRRRKVVPASVPLPETPPTSPEPETGAEPKRPRAQKNARTLENLRLNISQVNADLPVEKRVKLPLEATREEALRIYKRIYFRLECLETYGSGGEGYTTPSPEEVKLSADRILQKCGFSTASEVGKACGHSAMLKLANTIFRGGIKNGQ